MQLRRHSRPWRFFFQRLCCALGRPGAALLQIRARCYGFILSVCKASRRSRQFVAACGGLKSATARPATREQAGACTPTRDHAHRRSVLNLSLSFNNELTSPPVPSGSMRASRERRGEALSSFDLGKLACQDGKTATGRRQALSHRAAGPTRAAHVLARAPASAPYVTQP